MSQPIMNERPVEINRYMHVGMRRIDEPQILSVKSISKTNGVAQLIVADGQAQTCFGLEGAAQYNGETFVALSDPLIISTDAPVFELHIAKLVSIDKLMTLTDDQLSKVEATFSALKKTRSMPISDIEAILGILTEAG